VSNVDFGRLTSHGRHPTLEFLADSYAGTRHAMNGQALAAWNRPLRTVASAEITASRQTQIPVAKGSDARPSFLTIRPQPSVRAMSAAAGQRTICPLPFRKEKRDTESDTECLETGRTLKDLCKIWKGVGKRESRRKRLQ
jgi:hypothetical protein